MQGMILPTAIKENSEHHFDVDLLYFFGLEEAEYE